MFGTSRVLACAIFVAMLTGCLGMTTISNASDGMDPPVRTSPNIVITPEQPCPGDMLSISGTGFQKGAGSDANVAVWVQVVSSPSPSPAKVPGGKSPYPPTFPDGVKLGEIAIEADGTISGSYFLGKTIGPTRQNRQVVIPEGSNLEISAAYGLNQASYVVRTLQTCTTPR